MTEKHSVFLHRGAGKPDECAPLEKAGRPIRGKWTLNPLESSNLEAMAPNLLAMASNLVASCC